jgi:cytochrome c biogenesis protein CcdA
VAAAESPVRRPARAWLAAGVSAAVLALAIAAGVRSSPAAWGPLVFVESASARVSGMFLAFGTKAPLGYAFVAGMVASVNPCGFVLLPAYLSYYLGDGPEAPGGRGCTRPVFLGVVGTSLQLHGLAAGVGQFLLFGIGMGTVLAVLTLVTAWFGDGLIGRARILGRHVGWVSAVLLWLAGDYVVYYWLTAIRLL